MYMCIVYIYLNIHIYIDSGKCIPLYTYTCTYYEGFDASATWRIQQSRVDFWGFQMGDGPHHMVLPALNFPKGERISLPIYSWSHGRLDVYMHTLSFFVYISYMYIADLPICRYTCNIRATYIYIYTYIRFIYIRTYTHILVYWLVEFPAAIFNSAISRGSPKGKLGMMEFRPPIE